MYASRIQYFTFFYNCRACHYDINWCIVLLAIYSLNSNRTRINFAFLQNWIFISKRVSTAAPPKHLLMVRSQHGIGTQYHVFSISARSSIAQNLSKKGTHAMKLHTHSTPPPKWHSAFDHTSRIASLMDLRAPPMRLNSADLLLKGALMVSQVSQTLAAHNTPHTNVHPQLKASVVRSGRSDECTMHAVAGTADYWGGIAQWLTDNGGTGGQWSASISHIPSFSPTARDTSGGFRTLRTRCAVRSAEAAITRSRSCFNVGPASAVQPCRLMTSRMTQLSTSSSNPPISAADGWVEPHMSPTVFWIQTDKWLRVWKMSTHGGIKEEQWCACVLVSVCV